MKNEEKILSILEFMQSDIKSLKDGQANLEQGQANLEQGQALTNSRLDTLEQGQAVLQEGLVATNSHLDTLEKGLSATNSRLDTLEESVAKLSQSQARMENQLTEHIRGLWDFQSVQTDVNNRVLAALERIENKIEKHDIQIQALDLTKSNKRKIK